MLSLLIQAWAAQSEEQREGWLAQMRDNNAEVNVEIKYVDDDGDGDQLVINPTFFACMHIIWSIGEGQAGGAHQHRLLEGPASLSPLWSAPLALGDIKCLLQERRPL